VRPDEKKQLVSLLDQLGKAVEELLSAGLTAASKSTVERLDVGFKEASRMKLLRLGSTLRIANEEIVRFNEGSTQFSARRLSFFLGRAWLLAGAMRRALDVGDEAELGRLQATPVAQPVEKLRVVTLGVIKRVVPGAFASFDFRLRAIGAAGSNTADLIMHGDPLIWSCVFPLRKDLDLPSEAFLQLPQKQKFKPAILLEKKVVELTKCAVAPQSGGAARLTLSEASTVTAADPFRDWRSFWSWDVARAAERLDKHRPTPMDLDVELQEEAFFSHWRAGEMRETDSGYDLLPIETETLPLEVRLDRGPAGSPLRGVIKKMAAKKKGRPPLYGVVHYEACRLVLQPLTVQGKDGIEYISISPDAVSQAELVKAMKFT
jgi:hypothetical protein